MTPKSIFVAASYILYQSLLCETSSVRVQLVQIHTELVRIGRNVLMPAAAKGARKSTCAYRTKAYVDIGKVGGETLQSAVCFVLTATRKTQCCPPKKCTKGANEEGTFSY